jgi:hypothetical protein
MTSISKEKLKDALWLAAEEAHADARKACYDGNYPLARKYLEEARDYIHVMRGELRIRID